MILLNPIISGSMSMTGSMSVNNQSLDQYISASVVSQGLVSAGGGGSDSDLATYGLVGLQEVYYATVTQDS